MLDQLVSHWWLLALRGAFAILFGVLALVWPLATVWALVVLWGAYALVDGGVSLWAAVTGQGGISGGRRGWLAVQGVVGIGAGIVAFAWPGITALVLLWTIALWALVVGVMQIVGAIALRKEITNEWWLALSGTAMVLFGIALLVQPGTGALALAWLIGVFAIVNGVMLVALALRLRGLGHQDMRVAPHG